MDAGANERRIKEANACLQKAREHQKTSLIRLKTKPDHDSAAYEYERAAVCFRNADRLDLCRDAHLDAASCYNATKNLFHEAKSKESAAMACKDAKDFDGAERLFADAVDGYFASGSVVTATQTLDKAAKLLTPVKPEKAVELYEKGLKFAGHDESTRTVIGFFDRLIGLYLKLGRLDEARRVSRDFIEKLCEAGEAGKVGNVVLGMALIELKVGDSIAALNCLQQMPASIVGMFAADIAALKRLVKAFDEGDETAFQSCLKESVWRTLDNDFLRLSKTITVHSRHNKNVTGTTVGGTNQEGEEEDVC